MDRKFCQATDVNGKTHNYFVDQITIENDSVLRWIDEAGAEHTLSKHFVVHEVVSDVNYTKF